MITKKPSKSGKKVTRMYRSCPKCSASVKYNGKCPKCECDWERCLDWDIDLDYQMMQDSS